eukprot:jgi/Bigna1/34044/e_gw1.4.52.1
MLSGVGGVRAHPYRSSKAAGSDSKGAKCSCLPLLLQRPTIPRYSGSGETVRLKGSKNFRYRIVSAMLSGRPIVISDIRAEDESPGIKDYEASFLQMVDLVSSGSSISINETGTKLRYKPGAIEGGRGFELKHECPTSRGIGYFLEPLLLISIFGKKPTEITLTGVTDSSKDLCIDTIRNVTAGLIRHFGVEEKVSIKVLVRGVAPKGGGKVSSPFLFLEFCQPVSLLEPGKIKRFRGTSYVCRCSPQFANRMVTSARGILNRFIPDVYIHTDHCKGKAGGLSSGFGVSMTAESINGFVLSTQCIPTESSMPEEVGEKCAKQLVEQIAQGGCVDSNHQGMMCVLMALSPEDVSRLRIGKLSKPAIDILRLLQTFFGVTFMIKPDNKTNTVLLSCVGAGFQNFSRKHC